MQVGCASENNPYLKSNSALEMAPLGVARNCRPNRFRPLSPYSWCFTLQAKSKQASSLQAPIQPPMNDGNRPATESVNSIPGKSSNLTVSRGEAMYDLLLLAYFT